MSKSDLPNIVPTVIITLAIVVIGVSAAEIFGCSDIDFGVAIFVTRETLTSILNF